MRHTVIARIGLGMFLGSMVTGATVGCGSDSCADVNCAGGSRGIDVSDPGEALRFELCVDGRCYDLVHDRSMGDRWYSEDALLPDGEARYRVTAYGANDAVIARFDEQREPPGAECCGTYLPLRFDGAAITWDG